jgi:hypothetical protein
MKIQPTSRIANEEMEVSGKKLSMQQKILADLISHGEGTKDKVAERLGCKPEQTHKRFSELVKQGLVIDTGRKGILNSGLPGIIWSAKMSNDKFVSLLEKQPAKTLILEHELEFTGKNFPHNERFGITVCREDARQHQIDSAFFLGEKISIEEAEEMISENKKYHSEIPVDAFQPEYLFQPVYTIKPLLTHEETRSIVDNTEKIILNLEEVIIRGNESDMPIIAEGNITVENFNKPHAVQLNFFGNESSVSD